MAPDISKVKPKDIINPLPSNPKKIHIMYNIYFFILLLNVLTYLFYMFIFFIISFAEKIISSL